MENKEGDFELKNNWTKSVETFDQLEVKKDYSEEFSVIIYFLTDL